MARFRSVAHLDRPGEEVEAALFRRIEIGVERIAEMGDRVVEAGGAATPERMVPSPDFEATVDDVVAALAELIVHEQDEVAVGQATARAVIRGAERRLWGLGAISLVGASVIGLLLSRRITGPINQLLAAARGVGAGALTRVAVPGSDELAALAGAFNAMVDDVEAARSSLESAVAARTSELEAANVALRESIAERESTEARQRLMMHELDHRVKNTLAAVIALAGQTLEGASTKEEFRIALEGRLHAMARTHEALARERWKGVDVAEAVRLVLD
ncbi:MAG: HAMP domain-containing protein, partial [Phycisphaerales bacterium]|nr:HAMP domain-containing protein [Phycisphaerales bacterium]